MLLDVSREESWVHDLTISITSSTHCEMRLLLTSNCRKLAKFVKAPGNCSILLLDAFRDWRLVSMQIASRRST